LLLLIDFDFFVEHGRRQILLKFECREPAHRDFSEHCQNFSQTTDISEVSQKVVALTLVQLQVVGVVNHDPCYFIVVVELILIRVVHECRNCVFEKVVNYIRLADLHPLDLILHLSMRDVSDHLRRNIKIDVRILYH
jgi:hypothetical protein